MWLTDHNSEGVIMGSTVQRLDLAIKLWGVYKMHSLFLVPKCIAAEYAFQYYLSALFLFLQYCHRFSNSDQVIWGCIFSHSGFFFFPSAECLNSEATPITQISSYFCLCTNRTQNDIVFISCQTRNNPMRFFSLLSESCNESWQQRTFFFE